MLLKSSDLPGSNLPQPVENNARARGGPIREKSHSNEIVTVENAISVSGVIAIISLMAQDTAGLPLILYGRRGTNRFRAYQHAYYSLIHDAPNPEQTSVQFRELIVAHCIAWGNFFAQIITDNAGVARELWPLRPDRMTVMRHNGEKIYVYLTPEGKQRVFARDEILHIPGFGFDGLVGYSRISLARNAIGAAMSAEKYGSKMFANDTALGVVFMTTNELTEEAYERLDKGLNEEHEGVDNSHRRLILEGGLDVKRMGLPPEDAQYLETRKFQLDEINRIVGPIPPHLYGDTEKSTSWGTGLDSLEQGYVNHGLRPYAVRIEQALSQQLLLQADRDAGLYFEHLFDALLRGDLATRTEAYVKMWTYGIFTANQILAKENMNGYPGGDVHYRPANMVAIEKPGAQGPANALASLWQDAAQRVATREANDVRGAARRLLAKGQTDQFDAWLNQFYGKDQLAFSMKQFGPVLTAFEEINGIEYSGILQDYLTAGLNEHWAALPGMSIDQVDAMADGWQKNLAGEMSQHVLNDLKEMIFAIALEESPTNQKGIVKK